MSESNWRDVATEILNNKYNVPIRNFFTFEWGRFRNSNGVSVVVSHDLAYENIADIRELLSENLKVFIGTTRWLTELEQHADNKVELVIAPCKSQFDILRITQTADYNGNQSTEEIIEVLKKFDNDFGIEIYHAGFDELTFILENMPNNLQAFIQEIDELCPDALSQVYGSSELMIQEIKVKHEVYLWWD